MFYIKSALLKIKVSNLIIENKNKTIASILIYFKFFGLNETKACPSNTKLVGRGQSPPNRPHTNRQAFCDLYVISFDTI